MGVRPASELGPYSQGKREQILAAAQELFLARGFERTSMEAIREAAGVSKPTLYNHYDDKAALFADVVRLTVERMSGDLLPAVSARVATLGNREELRAALLHFAVQAIERMMSAEYLAMLRIVASEMQRFPEIAEVFRTVAPERGLHTAANFFSSAYERGLIRVADSELAARLFIGPLLTYLMLDGLLAPDGPRPPAPERIAAHVDLFLRAVC